MVQKGASDADVQCLIEDQMKQIYCIVGICLGVPNETFTWTYYDKNKTYHSIGPITPKEFYETHVKPVFNVDDKVIFDHIKLIFVVIYNLNRRCVWLRIHDQRTNTVKRIL